jgi:hypothetical protein
MADSEHDMLITREHAIAAATNVARQLGYAIGVHGSQLRDVDLIAAPWTDEAVPARELVESIAYALPGIVGHQEPERKPHGRLGWTIVPRYRWGIDAWYVDISVMPRRRRRKASA